MGVSTTHRINLSVWKLIYSFSDTYYVWAACDLTHEQGPCRNTASSLTPESPQQAFRTLSKKLGKLSCIIGFSKWRHSNRRRGAKILMAAILAPLTRLLLLWWLRKGSIQDILAWILDSTLLIPGTRFQCFSVKLIRFWIPIVWGIPDSLSCILDSKAQDSG